jgi:hypothetical protein
MATWKCASVNTLDSIPSFPGVYVFIHEGKAVYVGQSINLKQRLLTHDKIGRLSDGSVIKYKLVDKIGAWLMLELRLISKLRPQWNTSFSQEQHSWGYLRKKMKTATPEVLAVADAVDLQLDPVFVYAAQEIIRLKKMGYTFNYMSGLFNGVKKDTVKCPYGQRWSAARVGAVYRRATNAGMGKRGYFDLKELRDRTAA